MLLPLFEWFEASFLGQVVRTSVWLFPVTEAIHLLGLCLLGGAVLVVDLRMLGLGLTRQPIAELARAVRPWLVWAIVVLVTTGVLLFLSEAVKCYYNTSFWVKITTLPIAIAFTFAVRQRVALGESLDASARSRLVGAVSLALWFTVAAAGRWIGFS
jgi:hypothetical protein